MKLSSIFSSITNKKNSNKKEASKQQPKKKMEEKNDICPELSLEPELAPTNQVMIASCG